MKKKKVACWCSFEAISWLYPLTAVKAMHSGMKSQHESMMGTFNGALRELASAIAGVPPTTPGSASATPMTPAVAAPMLVNPAQAGHVVGGLELPPLHLFVRACGRPAASVPSFWCCGTWWRRLRVDGRSEGASPTLHGNLGRDRVSPLWVYEDGAVPDDRSRHVQEGVRLVPVYGQPGYAPPGSVHQTLGPRTMTGMTGSGASLGNCHITMENHNV